MAMIRICDNCGASMMNGKSYQFSVPTVLTDNDGTTFAAKDSSMTDICYVCATTKQTQVVAKLLFKAG